ncbi:MAG: hypothetical protein JWO56_3311 [Acidobacteria bacterium]|nr:hypothetical protein [Acidobacteriota bacterium]
MKGRLKKIVLMGIVSLAVIGMSAHLIWKYSGSGQWVSMGEKKGVKLYAQKVPGETVKRFKGVVRLRSTLTTAMAASQDATICDHGCFEPKMFERVDELRQFYTFKWNYPFNTWQSTPVGNGELELESVVYMDDGGFFPYPLANYGAPIFIRHTLRDLQPLLDREQRKFPDAKFALLAESRA